MTNSVTMSRWASGVIKRINAGETVRIYHGQSLALVDALVALGAAVRGSSRDGLLFYTWVGPRR